MENLAFVLWVCLWPVATSINDHLNTKRRIALRKEDFSDEVNRAAKIIILVIWIVVAIMLYK